MVDLRTWAQPFSLAGEASLALHNKILRGAQAFCPISIDIERELLDAGVKPSKIWLLPNVYDSSKFIPASAHEKCSLRRKLSIDDQRVVAIFTGRLVSWKGPQHLVRMWHQLAENPILLFSYSLGRMAMICLIVPRRFETIFNSIISRRMLS